MLCQYRVCSGGPSPTNVSVYYVSVCVLCQYRVCSGGPSPTHMSVCVLHMYANVVFEYVYVLCQYCVCVVERGRKGQSESGL